MAFDGIICSNIVNELNNVLIDGKINKVFEPNKNEILLGIYSCGKNYALDICIDCSNYRINLTTHSRENPKNVLNFCMVLRKNLIGSTIKKIYMDGLERIVYIKIECFNEFNDLVEKTLIIELMGKHSNIILLDNNNKITDSLRHLEKIDKSTRDILPGYNYETIVSDKADFTKYNFNKFYDKLLTSSGKLDTKISNLFTGFSKFGISTILNNLNIENISTISIDQCKKIYDYLSKLITANNLAIIKYENNYYISQNNKSDKLDNNFFIDDYYFEKEKEEKFINYKNSLLHLVLESLKKLKSKLSVTNNTLNECKNMDTYKLYGELITSNLYKINNLNEKSIMLENYYDNNKEISIPLDSSISPSKNAKLYFKKYRKLQNAFVIMQNQKKLIQSEIDYYDNLMYDINNAQTIDEISLIKEELSCTNLDTSKSQSMHNKSDNKKSAMIPAEYIIDGYTILVGKNSKQNDYLTCKLAKKSDLWFHTKDIPSSHVILRLNNGLKVTDSIIYKCATITAFFSKAKLSKNVPVDYTYIKYVHKPNGAKSGMVIYTNNKTLYVDPKSPI